MSHRQSLTPNNTHTQRVSQETSLSVCQLSGFPNKSRQAFFETRYKTTHHFCLFVFGDVSLVLNCHVHREHKVKKKKKRTTAKTLSHQVVVSGLILVFMNVDCSEMNVCIVRGHWRLTGSRLIRTKLY